MSSLKSILKSVPGLVRSVRFLKGAPYPMPREWIIQNISQGSVGAEIGVYEGDFSKRILRGASPDVLHLIDPWEHIPEYESAWYGGQDVDQSDMDTIFKGVKQRFDSEISAGQVQIHRAQSSEVVDLFDDHYFDWIYIDGNHEYEYVLQDLKLYYSKVKTGGLIMGDDYGVEGWWENGVTRAVDEFSNSHGLQVRTKGIQFVLQKTK